MSISLLHLSDIHPASSDNLTKLAHEISSAVRRSKCSPTYLVASGDLGLKGNNQQESAKFLLTLASDLGLGPTQIVCVPGNHDIERDNKKNPFQNYSKAIYAITKNSARTVVSPVTLYPVESVEFVLINSAYHLDTTFGRVDCDALRKVMGDLSANTLKIVVVHHNLIPVEEKDRSTIVNAYEFLTIVSSVGCEVVLHGHQHTSLSLIVGSSTKLVGVGTVKFAPATNVNNQFNLIDIGKRVVRFRYHADSSTSRGFGNWDPEEIPW
ncbi:metallophosphoesterase family protein [Tunturiibacter gelidoferens]|uniref:3',5'-cyclic AMP phosphodiesterase CpdA n=1 Tax=Tunturiibacter gelidiferens TaxID=3069689 RepID=A0ACC5P4D7_9BACT|nr:metallophosphoesterase [Edaphobacter lichenicola]MBB5341448.1 3',5'-cyclic AMP phosphodiesterase CpdA [Edaphobacter lichenicola]